MYQVTERTTDLNITVLPPRNPCSCSFVQLPSFKVNERLHGSWVTTLLVLRWDWMWKQCHWANSFCSHNSMWILKWMPRKQEHLFSMYLQSLQKSSELSCYFFAASLFHSPSCTKGKRPRRRCIVISETSRHKYQRQFHSCLVIFSMVKIQWMLDNDLLVIAYYRDVLS